MMLKRFRSQLFACLLPALLLFAQQGAMAHLASHIGEDSSAPEKTLVHLKLCGKCLSIKKLTDARAGPEFRPAILETHYCDSYAPPAVLRSTDAGRTNCRDPPHTL